MDYELSIKNYFTNRNSLFDILRFDGNNESTYHHPGRFKELLRRVADHTLAGPYFNNRNSSLDIRRFFQDPPISGSLIARILAFGSPSGYICLLKLIASMTILRCMFLEF